MNKPGPDEIVQNGENGYLVDSDLEFTSKVLDILNDSTLRKNLSISAIKTAHKF